MNAAASDNTAGQRSTGSRLSAEERAQLEITYRVLIKEAERLKKLLKKS